jgi:hypothetical protein
MAAFFLTDTMQHVEPAVHAGAWDLRRLHTGWNGRVLVTLEQFT